jgi:hypothetical protein
MATMMQVPVCLAMAFRDAGLPRRGAKRRQQDGVPCGAFQAGPASHSRVVVNEHAAGGWIHLHGPDTCHRAERIFDDKSPAWPVAKGWYVPANAARHERSKEERSHGQALSDVVVFGRP